MALRYTDVRGTATAWQGLCGDLSVSFQLVRRITLHDDLWVLAYGNCSILRDTFSTPKIKESVSLPLCSAMSLQRNLPVLMYSGLQLRSRYCHAVLKDTLSWGNAVEGGLFQQHKVPYMHADIFLPQTAAPAARHDVQQIKTAQRHQYRANARRHTNLKAFWSFLTFLFEEIYQSKSRMTKSNLFLKKWFSKSKIGGMNRKQVSGLSGTKTRLRWVFSLSTPTAKSLVHCWASNLHAPNSSWVILTSEVDLFHLR